MNHFPFPISHFPFPIPNGNRNREWNHSQQHFPLSHESRESRESRQSLLLNLFRHHLPGISGLECDESNTNCIITLTLREYSRENESLGPNESSLSRFRHRREPKAMKLENHKCSHWNLLSGACHNAVRGIYLSFSLFHCDSEILNANVKLEGDECERDSRRQQFDQKPWHVVYRPRASSYRIFLIIDWHAGRKRRSMTLISILWRVWL
jgi:hypothetical protein